MPFIPLLLTLLHKLMSDKALQKFMVTVATTLANRDTNGIKPAFIQLVQDEIAEYTAGNK
jgi:hypothetical protein